MPAACASDSDDAEAVVAGTPVVVEGRIVVVVDEDEEEVEVEESTNEVDVVVVEDGESVLRSLGDVVVVDDAEWVVVVVD